jgi:hypothetical protein
VIKRVPGAEDSWGFYTGDRVAWTTGGSSATAKLAATLVDPNGGDITQAKVTFLLDGNPIPSAQNFSVGRVDPSKDDVGVAAAIVQLNIGKSTSETHLVTVEIVGDFYTTGDVLNKAQVMVVTPVPGGRILGANAALANLLKARGYLGTASIGSQSAFDIQYNKSLKNPQGKLNVYIVSANKPDVTLTTGPVSSGSRFRYCITTS